MGEFTGAGSQENFDFVVSQGDHEVRRVIAIEIVTGNGNGSPMYRIAGTFFKFSVGPAEEYGHFVAPGTGQDHIGVGVVIIHPEGERAGLFASIELDLIAKGAVTVTQENRERIATDVGRQQIGKAVLIDISGCDGRRILPYFVTGKVVKEVWRCVGVLLGTAAYHQQEETYRHDHEVPWPPSAMAIGPSNDAPLSEKGTSNREIRPHKCAL
jgi:hypothetical protein